jgi:hypothetical protein
MSVEGLGHLHHYGDGELEESKIESERVVSAQVARVPVQI